MLSSTVSTFRSFTKWFTSTNEWIDIEGNIGTIGISNYAAHHLGDIMAANILTNKEVKIGDEIGDIESSKTTTAIFSPMEGKIHEVNPEILDNPSIINRSAERKGWLCKITLTDPSNTNHLMDIQSYRDSIKV